MILFSALVLLSKFAGGRATVATSMLDGGIFAYYSGFGLVFVDRFAETDLYK
jgi:hypothetical protein